LRIEDEKVPFRKLIEAIYWADPLLIIDANALAGANMIVHDTSFGIQNPKCVMRN
jgi:hypothetical protein